MASSEISHLRSHVNSHPKDARSIALLANLIVEREKLSQTKNPSSTEGGDGMSKNDCCHQEAISLANASIQLSPKDAIGYGVLSTIPTLKFRERMKFLRKAVDLEQERASNNAVVSSHVAIAKSLVRLLIEPREEMARGKDRLHAKRIMQRDLCVNSLTGLDERNIYDELYMALETAKRIIWKKREDRWLQATQQQTEQAIAKNNDRQANDSQAVVDAFSSIPPNIQSLAKAHYWLGSFFRTIIQPNSRYHFRSVLELLNPPYMNTSFNLESQMDLHDLTTKSKFWLATLEQQDESSSSHGVHSKNMQVDRCPKEYVISLYSSFAANFDTQLTKKLKYETPTKLRKLLDRERQLHLPEKMKALPCFHHGVDLGCGTGLSGVAFRDLVEHLVGVDLSPEMVAKAEGRGCYDVVRVGDVESVLTDTHVVGCLDLVVACDVFVYIGDLRSVFQSVSKRLAPGHGLFAFSTELLGEGQHVAGEDRGFLLQSCARFAHKQSYIHNLAKESGFLVKAMREDVIRKNGGKDVVGILAILSLA